MQISYEQAVAAHERGEKVECRNLCKCPAYSIEWTAFNPKGSYLSHEFRLADPYAELKAAKAQGKVIQEQHTGQWWDSTDPSWMKSPHYYRVKPDELKIEVGKEYIDDPITRDPNIWRVLCTDALGKFPVVAISGYELSRFNMEGKSESGFWTLIAPYTPAPAPYDNWQHVPAWHRWMWKNEAGRWYSSFDKPTARQREDASGWDALFIPSKYEPTNFTGEWQSSLQEKPKQ